jgi:hypothetical protein
VGVVESRGAGRPPLGSPCDPGIDIIVDDRDRHVLELLRSAGHVSHHPTPALSICRVDPVNLVNPNESLRIHFPTTPPLSSAFTATVGKEIGGVVIPVVDLVTLTLANLLSRRTGSEQAVAVAVAAGVSRDTLSACLTELDRLPKTKSPYILRVFDRDLALRRLLSMRDR